MASSSETGHVKNVNHLEDLITFCSGYGVAYNPSKVIIQMAGLNQLLTAAKATIEDVNKKLIDYANAVNNRQIKYQNLKKLGTRLVSALSATDANSKTIENAIAINRKIQGGRAAAKVTPTPATGTDPTPESKSYSVAQQSYGMMADHLSKLILLLQSEPSYNPNEPELKISGLNTLLSEMLQSNTAVMNAMTNLSNARLNRNKQFYSDDNCLFECAAQVKNYVKSAFGATSPEYKQISSLKFTKRL